MSATMRKDEFWPALCSCGWTGFSSQVDAHVAAAHPAGKARASHRFNNHLRYRDESDPRQVQLTPSYLIEPIREVLGGLIALDPCTEPDNPTQAEWFYTPPEDGAALPWNVDSIFVNPPYGKARERWVRRCMEAGRDGSRVVLLIPAHTDTRIFQTALASASSVLFIRGRVKFGVLRPNRRQAAASHPSALIGWNVDLRHIAHLGTAIRLDDGRHLGAWEWSRAA